MEDYETRYWTEKFGVSQDRLKAVRAPVARQALRSPLCSLAICPLPAPSLGPRSPPRGGRKRAGMLFRWGRTLAAKEVAGATIHVYRMPFGRKARAKPPFPSDRIMTRRPGNNARPEKGRGRGCFGMLQGRPKLSSTFYGQDYRRRKAAFPDANCRNKQTSKIAYDRLDHLRSRSRLPRNGDSNHRNSMRLLTALVATWDSAERLLDQFERRFPRRRAGPLCEGPRLFRERAQVCTVPYISRNIRRHLNAMRVWLRTVCMD